MKSGSNADHGPYSPKTGVVDAKIHYGAGKIGKDYGIAKNKENVRAMRPGSK